MSGEETTEAGFVSSPRCSECGIDRGSPRLDFHLQGIVVICDECTDRRAVACPFCGSPFGRVVKRASRCKGCGETVARNGRSPILATRLATVAISEALGEFESINLSEQARSWLNASLLRCLLESARAGRDPKVLDAAFALSLRVQFENGLTQDRLSLLGFGFARAIWICGGNPRPIQRTMQRVRLESLRQSGLVQSVEVLPAGDPCERCKGLVGRVWTIDAALAENPLPCRDCCNINQNGFGWCRCEYQERLPDDYEACLPDDYEEHLPDEYKPILRDMLAEIVADQPRSE